MPISIRICALALVLGISAPLADARAAWADQPDHVIADVVARVQGGVVRIIAVPKPDKKEEPKTAKTTAADSQPTYSIGSGFVIDPSGLVATNRHVVVNAISIFVGTQDGARYRAEIVGMPGKADIALLRVHPDKPMPSLTFGNSDALRAGDTIIAIGSPFGFDNSVTAGIVSSTNRDIMESPFDDYIQTDAAINHGNSGGPLFNLRGEVVGMASVLFAPTNETGSVGLGFAIPSNELRFVFDRLEQYGTVRAGMLPLRTQQVSAMMARAIGAPGPGGALVIGLEPGAIVMGGAIDPGDVIETFNGVPVQDPRDLARKAGVSPIGTDATLTLSRGGKTLSVTVPILAFDDKDEYRGGTTPPPKTLGLTFAFEDENTDSGVKVAAIDRSGSAADSGLREGDTILMVQQRLVSTPKDVTEALQERIKADQPYAALLMERDGKQSWIPVALPDKAEGG